MMKSRIVTALFTALPSLAGAQPGARDALIPRQLVEALLTTTGWPGSGGRPEIIVGALPPVLAGKVRLPAGTTILGGLTMSEANTGVILLDGPLNSVSGQFHRDLLAQGWEAPVESPMDFIRSEFVDPPSTDRRVVAPGTPEMYCGRAGTLNVQYHPDGFQRTQITLTTTAVNQCALMRDQMFRMRSSMMRDETTRPKLFNHPAARNSPGACPEYNMGMGDRNTSLGSQLAPAEILAHYAKQLADSGWTQSGTTVAALFQKRDTTGSTIEYQLVVHGPNLGAGCRSVRTDLNGRSR